jgi:hypothetical protein
MEGLGIEDCGKYDTSDCSDKDDEDHSSVGKYINTIIHTSVINEFFGSLALPFTADTLSYHQEDDNNLSGSVAIDGSIGTTPVMEPTSTF